MDHDENDENDDANDDDDDDYDDEVDDVDDDDDGAQGQWERYSKLVVWDNFANYTVCVIQLSASAGFKREKAK